MLKFLRVNNIAVIREAQLDLGPGLTLLTGETGAGKSILIDALGLLLGDRASPDLIRTGETQAVVEGVLGAPGLAALLEARALPADDDEIIVRRELQASGKSRATVNGALVPISVLRELAPALVTVHGQHESYGLLDPDTHLAVLDEQAELGADMAPLAERYAAWRGAEGMLAEFRARRAEGERRRELLEFSVGEIDNAHLQPGEDDALGQEKEIQANAERLATLAAEAYRQLYEDEGAVLPALAQVFRRVDDLARIDARLQPYAELRTPIQAQLQDLALFLRDYVDRIDRTPGRLDAIETRLSQIERLKKKYGPTLDDVIARGERDRAERARFANPEQAERELVAGVEKAARGYVEIAARLSKRRQVAARALEKQVEAALADLAMPRSKFAVRFAEGDPEADTTRWTDRGFDAVEFLLSANPGEEARPLSRIASGGELSRILLALESVASARGEARTLVFDEVDAGIGGRVAEVVGRKLKAIAARHQVLCVSHLPQIAAQADTHFAVGKRQSGGRTLVDVRALDADQRVEEVARMLAGETITDIARQHAREMIGPGSR